ncbi:MAG: DNA repair protein RecO [Sphingobacterium sp.]|nr:DNA repair protein RecO [Sphingobacterium sp.]
MPTDQAEAIVLRTTNIGDQDKIAVFFCREKGVLRGVAKGARKFGNRFGSSLEPMSVVRVFYYEKERRDLVTVSGCDLIESFFEVQTEPRDGLPADLFRGAHRGVRPGPGPRGGPLPAPPLRPPLPQGRRRPGVHGGLLRGLVPPGQRPPAGPLRLQERAASPSPPSWLAPRRDGAYCPDCTPVKKDEVPPAIRDFLRWTRKNPPSGVCAPPFPPGRDRPPSARSLQAMIVYHMEREPRTPAVPQGEVSPICYNRLEPSPATGRV